MAEAQLHFYPLGENLYAYVRQRGKTVKIYLCHYTYSKKKAKTVASQRRVTMDLSQFQRLCKVKSKLVADHERQTEEAAELNKTKLPPVPVYEEALQQRPSFSHDSVGDVLYSVIVEPGAS